jgi:hypothetical protein
MHKLRRLTSHRLIAVLTALLLLVAEAGLLVHQVEHQLGPNHDRCALCLVADHFGAAVATKVPSIAAAVRHEPPAATVVRRYSATVPDFFQARAPPLQPLSS